MDSSPDQTLLNLVGVHRFEVNQLEAEVNNLSQSVNHWRDKENRASAEVARLKNSLTRSEEAVEQRRKSVVEITASYEKRGEVIDSLKLELAGEREAHSGLRDNVGEFRTQITAALIELTTHGDLTPAGRDKLLQILGGDR